MELLDQYMAARRQLLDYFGYKGRLLPIEDSRSCFWHLAGRSNILFTKNENKDDVWDHYCEPCRGVYRGEAYTMVMVDPDLSGRRQYLQIFDNDKEREDK